MFSPCITRVGAREHSTGSSEGAGGFFARLSKAVFLGELGILLWSVPASRNALPQPPWTAPRYRSSQSRFSRTNSPSGHPKCPASHTTCRLCSSGVPSRSKNAR